LSHPSIAVTSEARSGMKKAVENSYQVAKLAIDSLREYKLPATPHNYELWHDHVDGRNPNLSRAIQRVIESEGTVKQSRANALYQQHIVRNEMSADVIEIVSQFETEISALTEVLKTSGENTHKNSESLETLSNEIGSIGSDSEGVNSLLENVLSVVKEMREENVRLESRLAESAGEVTALRTSIETIQKEAMLDGLTGLGNRRTFDNAISALVEESRETKSPLCVVLADIDHFKKFNDQWGHQTGDQVLRLVADVLSANAKGQDVLARYGGEEFAAILPATELENAVMLADRMRGAVQTRRLKKRSTGEDLGVITVSMGVALLSDADDVETVIERADACLYEAKHRGRNQVVDEVSLRDSDSGNVSDADVALGA
ncbi:MAG: GGDEF domain-containing protein, partial [Pseudomonadota bacterium]